jgi:hypothetical protein
MDVVHLCFLATMEYWPSHSALASNTKLLRFVKGEEISLIQSICLYVGPVYRQVKNVVVD